jgi:hypothetical protein
MPRRVGVEGRKGEKEKKKKQHKKKVIRSNLFLKRYGLNTTLCIHQWQCSGAKEG